MADFFKGLTGGFQTGLQFGGAIRERNMRDELAQAYAKPEEFTDYTPEQLKQIQGLQAAGGYDVQAVPGAEGQAPTLRYTAQPNARYYDDNGNPEAPIEIAPQRVQRYGGQTAAGQFDPTALRGLQMQEAARVLGSYGDVRGAAALQAQADEQAYQAKYRPLQLQQLEGSIAGQNQQRELTGIQLGSAKRTETELQRASDFASFAADNPNATTQELKEAAFKQFKFTPKQWQDAVNTRLGIKENEQKDFVLNIKDKLKGKNLAQLGSLYNTDPDFDDKTDLAIVPGKNGAVTLNFVDKASGRVTGSQSFKNEAMATEYLNKQATEPETIGSWMMNLSKVESGIEKDRAAIRASDAQATLAGPHADVFRAQADYYKNRGNADKMGGTQYFTGQDGNMYASTPVFSPTGGLKFETTRVNPDNVKFQKPGVEGAGAKPVDVKEEGTKVTIGGQLRVADGLGNYIDPKGVLPNARPKVLKEANIPDNLAAELPWNQNGTAVGFGGKSYDVRNAADMKALKADYERLGKNTIAVEEAQRNIPRQQTGVRYDPYGASQRPRMGATQAEVDAFNAMRAREALSRQIGQSQVGLYNTSQYGLE